MLVAMLAGWEIVLMLMVMATVFMASRGFQAELIARDGKKAFFYLLMTVGAVIVGCLLALVVTKVLED